MNRDTIKEILYIVIAIIMSVIAIKFVIWALPVILVILLALFIYISIKKDKYKENDVKVNKNTNKNKKMKVIHEFDDKD